MAQAERLEMVAVGGNSDVTGLPTIVGLSSYHFSIMFWCGGAVASFG